MLNNVGHFQRTTTPCLCLLLRKKHLAAKDGWHATRDPSLSMSGCSEKEMWGQILSAWSNAAQPATVSYTHLTLPTKA